MNRAGATRGVAHTGVGYVTKPRISGAACSAVSRFLALVLPTFAAVGCGGDGAGQKLYAERRLLLGTQVAITVGCGDEARAKRAVEKAFGRIARLEDRLSRWRPESVVSRLNRAAGKEAVNLSGETCRLLVRAREFSALSGGAFDVTVGPYVLLWKRAEERGSPPTGEEFKKTRDRVGYDRIVLNPEMRSGRLPAAGMTVDLGAIAKGYCVDAAIETLREEGIANALVNAGGDVRAIGPRPDGKPWRIGVQNPDLSDKGSPLLGVLAARDVAVATSGSYRQFRRIGGRRYSHIINPRTGVPADEVPSATVIAPDATTADALATALSVLGVREGLALVERMPGAEALLITREGGRMAFHRSSGFGAFELQKVGR